jgi:hypothetical protein
MTNIIEIQPDDTAAIAAVDKIECKHPTLTELQTHERSLAAVAHSEPIAADCHFTYPAAHSSGHRPLRVINLIVIHDTEGGTAQSNASYFKLKTSGGSTQLVVDDNSCYRCLRDNQIPWGAPGSNYTGLHIEQCGYAKWTATVWSKKHRKTLLRAAYKTAYNCRKYGITPRFLTAANLKAGMKNGITTHRECSLAFGGTHVDPGVGWPRTLFMTFVKGFYRTLFRVKKIA